METSVHILPRVLLGRMTDHLGPPELAVLFGDALFEGRLDPRWATARPLAQAILLDKIGVITLIP